MAQDNNAHSRIHLSAGDDAENTLYPRYLAAKKGIDDRSLNSHVWETLRQALPQTAGHEKFRILEIGAGIGTMFARLVDRGLLNGPAEYLATDSDAGHLRAARGYLSQWAADRGHVLSWQDERHGRLRSDHTEVSLLLDHVSAEELAKRSPAIGPFHLLIAHAVLDLVDFPAVLPPLLTHLTAGGLACLTCNFDGETVFLPEFHGMEEEEIIRRYHASMEKRLSGASRTGRRLLAYLQRPGLELLAAGSSDWVVHPRGGRYSGDEAFFLHAIIATVERQLAGENDPPSDLADWADLRHRQIEAGELSFLARHLDLLARRLPPPP